MTQVMFSESLDRTFDRANEHARARNQAPSVEHLLLALLDDPDAAGIIRKCNVDSYEICQELTAFLDHEAPRQEKDGENYEPTTGFQRAIYRAIIYAQNSGLNKVTKITGANVLVSIFSERDSHAARLLVRNRIYRQDVIEKIRERNRSQ